MGPHAPILVTQDSQVYIQHLGPHVQISFILDPQNDPHVPIEIHMQQSHSPCTHIVASWDQHATTLVTFTQMLYLAPLPPILHLGAHSANSFLFDLERWAHPCHIINTHIYHPARLRCTNPMHLGPTKMTVGPTCANWDPHLAITTHSPWTHIVDNRDRHATIVVTLENICIYALCGPTLHQFHIQGHIQQTRSYLTYRCQLGQHIQIPLILDPLMPIGSTCGHPIHLLRCPVTTAFLHNLPIVHSCICCSNIHFVCTLH